MEKSCTKCEIVKSLDDFHRSSTATDKRASWCKKCANSIARVSRKRNHKPGQKRKWQLRTRYGLTPEDVATLLEKQNGSCVLCPTVLSKFHIDHDHNTGEIRGILCHRCNIRLGGWDDLEWRANALKYLRINQ